MNRWIGRLGVACFLLFCAAGLAAWVALPTRITILLGDEGSGPGSRQPGSERDDSVLLAELEASEARAQQRIQALEDQLSQAFSALEAPFQSLLEQGARSGDLTRDLGLRVAELQGRVAALQELRVVVQGASGAAGAPIASSGAAAPPPQDPPEAPTEEPADPVTQVSADTMPDTGPTVAKPVSFTQLFQRAEQAPKGAGRVQFELVEGACKVGFDGSSNLHDFSGSTTTVAGELEFLPSKPEDSPSASVRIQAPSLVTGDEDRDEEMHGHYLESAKHEEISFRLDSLTDVVHETDKVFTAQGHGTFLCHGVTKELVVPVRVERVGSSTVKMTGEWKMLMSDHGIKPPKALGGLITTDDEVTAWFHLQARARR